MCHASMPLVSCENWNIREKMGKYKLETKNRERTVDCDYILLYLYFIKYLEKDDLKYIGGVVNVSGRAHLNKILTNVRILIFLPSQCNNLLIRSLTRYKYSLSHIPYFM